MTAQQRFATFGVAPKVSYASSTTVGCIQSVTEVSYVSSTTVGCIESVIRRLICQLHNGWLHSEYHKKSHTTAQHDWLHSEYQRKSRMLGKMVSCIQSIIRSLICQLNNSWLHLEYHQKSHMPAQQQLAAFRVHQKPHLSVHHSWLHSEYHQKSHMSAQQQLAAFRVSSEVSYACSTTVGCIQSTPEASYAS